MKKLLIATLTMMMIGGTTVKAETNFKPHKECFAMPVLVKVENNGAYLDRTEFYHNGASMWKGITSSGIEVEGYLLPNVTVYPK